VVEAQWINAHDNLVLARGFFGKAATSLFSHATAPGVWRQAGPQSLT